MEDKLAEYCFLFGGIICLNTFLRTTYGTFQLTDDVNFLYVKDRRKTSSFRARIRAVRFVSDGRNRQQRGGSCPDISSSERLALFPIIGYVWQIVRSRALIK